MPAPPTPRAPLKRAVMHSIIGSGGSPRRLSIRLASCDADIAAAQQLRWSVFYDEMKAHPLPDNGMLDADRYDALCDHLLVEDNASGAPVVVGTYRLLWQSVAEAGNGFYSAGEYELAPLARRCGDMLELGDHASRYPIAIAAPSRCCGAGLPLILPSMASR